MFCHSEMCESYVFYHLKMCLAVVEQGAVIVLDMMAIGWIFVAFVMFIIPEVYDYQKCY